MAGNVLYEARELCTGGELFDEVAEVGDLLSAGMLPQALRWFAQTTSAVSHAHSVGAVHGRLRPEHLLLGYETNGCCTALHAQSGEASVRVLGFQSTLWREFKHGALESMGSVVAARSPDSSPVHDSSASAESLRARPLQLHRRTWAHDAPELHNVTCATWETLAAADSWALGILLTCMIAGEPPKPLEAGGGGAARVFLPPTMTAAPIPVLELVRAMLDPLPHMRPSAASIRARADALLMPPPSLLMLPPSPPSPAGRHASGHGHGGASAEEPGDAEAEDATTSVSLEPVSLEEIMCT